MALGDSSVPNTADEVLAQVNALVDVLRARAPETERLRRMHRTCVSLPSQGVHEYGDDVALVVSPIELRNELAVRKARRQECAKIAFIPESVHECFFERRQKCRTDPLRRFVSGACDDRGEVELRCKRAVLMMTVLVQASGGVRVRDCVRRLPDDK